MPARHHRPAIGLIIGTGEGWALYAERLADEMGLYSTPLDRLGMLASDSLRACRLVVDTGLHALGWSRRQAIEYMVRNSPLREGPRTRSSRRLPVASLVGKVSNEGAELAAPIGPAREVTTLV